MANIQIHIPVDAADQFLQKIAPMQQEGTAGMHPSDADNPALPPIQRINAIVPRPRTPYPRPQAPSANAAAPSGPLPPISSAPIDVAKPHQGFGSRIGGILGRIGGYALSAVAPGIAAEIPSTPLGKIAAHNRELANELTQSRIGSEQASAQAENARAGLENAQTNTLLHPQEKPSIEQSFLQDYAQRNPNATLGDALKAYTSATAKPAQPKTQRAGEYREYIVPGKKEPVLAREDEQGNLITREGTELPAGVQIYEKPEAGTGGTWSLQTIYGPDQKPHSVFVNSKTMETHPYTGGTKVNPESGKIKAIADQQKSFDDLKNDVAKGNIKVGTPDYSKRVVEVQRAFAAEMRAAGQVPMLDRETWQAYVAANNGDEKAAAVAAAQDGFAQ